MFIIINGMLLMVETEEQATAIENIFKNYYVKMYQFAMNILKNHHDAEEVTMETFCKISKNAQYFVLDNEEELARLVFVCIKNEAKTYFNKRKRERVSSLTVYTDEDPFEDRQMDIIDESQDLDRWIVERERLDHIKELIASIPAEQRMAFNMRICGLSYQGVSDFLGITEEAARGRVCRFRKKIKELAKEKDDE